jgi:hypothetical protein
VALTAVDALYETIIIPTLVFITYPISGNESQRYSFWILYAYLSANYEISHAGGIFHCSGMARSSLISIEILSNTIKIYADILVLPNCRMILAIGNTVLKPLHLFRFRDVISS